MRVLRQGAESEPIAEAAAKTTSSNGFWKRFRRHRPATIGLIFVILVALAAVFAPLISPYNPYEMHLASVNQAPSLQHWLGTDSLGRDIMTRILYGGRVSIEVSVSAVAISTVLGTFLGIVAGFHGGWLDSLIMRMTDVFMAFPLFLLVIVTVPLLGPSPLSIIAVIGLFSWMTVARLVRGETLSIVNEPYTEAATSVGASSWRIIFRHILPNAAAPIVVSSTLGVATAMLTEAALSFLGLGIQPPIPSWGNMLTAAEQLQVLAYQPWTWMGPGAAIALTVLSINFIGDGIRDALDPHQQAVANKSQ